jgi:hypothetical protein
MITKSISFQRGILTKNIRNLYSLTNHEISIIVGLLLSDAWIQKRKGWNAQLGLKQSIINFSYLWSVYTQLSILCSNYPYLSKKIMRGKLFYSLSFETRQLRCLKWNIWSFFFPSPRKEKKMIQFQ